MYETFWTNPGLFPQLLARLLVRKFAGVKRPLVNLEEEFGKMVGSNISGAADYDRLVDAAEQIMPTLPFPKGVYRFRSFEEADAWTEHHILKAAREKNRARRDAAT